MGAAWKCTVAPEGLPLLRGSAGVPGVGPGVYGKARRPVLTDPAARQLENKVALVTGAAQGVGRGIALVLGSRGAIVAVSDLNLDGARAVAGEIAAAGGRALAVGGDVTDPESMVAVADEVIQSEGRIDICVANAGVPGAAGYENRAGYTRDDWDLTLDVNVKGLVCTIDAVVPHMKERRSGKIVTVASHAGRKPRGAVMHHAASIPYAVSKAAAIQLTHQLAIYLAPYDINVNAVCPGLLWTPMWDRIARSRRESDPALQNLSPREVFDRDVKSRTPLGRPQTPEDIGRAVAFLVSDDASEITGQALNVNGGAVMN